MELKIGMIDKHHMYSKHNKLSQNLRGSLQFFDDWVYNDTLVKSGSFFQVVYPSLGGKKLYGTSLLQMPQRV